MTNLNKSYIDEIKLITQNHNIQESHTDKKIKADKKKTKVIIKKEKIPATIRNQVWSKYNNIKDPKCWCCKTEPITRNNFECGHVISEYNKGTVHLDNLRPICSLCNKSMGTKNMIEFMEKYGCCE